MPPAASKPTHNNTQTVPSLSRRDKSEDWTFEESKTRIWIELWRWTKSNILFPRRRKDPIDCSMLATCPHCRCPVSGLCHCWGRGRNFPHYRQNYFPNTLISTCPALILLLKSDKSSQMLHCTVRPVSKIDLLVESILRTAELCLALLTKQTTNSPLSTHSEIGPMTIMLSKSPPFNSWIWKYTLCRLAAGCQNQSNLKSEPELEIWWTSRNCNHSVPNGPSVAAIKKSFRTIPYLSHMWLASRRLLHIIFIDNDNRQYWNCEYRF